MQLSTSIKAMLYRLARIAEMDRAVVFGVFASCWQLLSAPVTLLIIAHYATLEIQGFYYTFGSLLALQTYVELGLSVVVLNSASHEWAYLRLDADGRLVGNPDALSRLISLGRFVFKWYAAAGGLFVVGVGAAGYVFFSRNSASDIAWRVPWFTLVGLTGILLWALPFNAILEGCNQVATIQRFRLSQLVLRSLALWATFAVGAGLWAIVAAAAIAVLRDVYLLGVQYRSFFRPFFLAPTHSNIHWKTEIWPMQWRLGVGGMASYFLFQSFNPIMFHYHGAAMAGRTGMTLSVVAALQSLAAQWLPPKVPRFGELVALRDYANLDRLWLRTARAVLVVACAGAVGAWVLILGLNWIQAPLADRLLSPEATALFLTGAVFYSLGYCETVYLRAHKKEPLLVLSVVTSIFMGLLVWWLGGRYGPIGAATAYLVVFGVISLPWETAIMLRCRTLWHAT